MTAFFNKSADWLRWIALGIPAAALAFAGASKLVDPAAFAAAILNYKLVSPLVAGVVAVYLPWLELVVACGLIVRKTLRAAWLLALLVMAGFTLLLLVTVARGIDVRCGCFGSAAGQGTTAGWAVLRNGVLIALLLFGRKTIGRALPV